MKIWFVLGLFTVMLSGCSMLVPTASIKGTVSYLERISLPEDAILTVQISEVWADRSPVLIGKSTQELEGQQVPIPFEVKYEKQAIREENFYIVEASIEDENGKVLFQTTTTEYRIITNGNPVEGIEVILSGAAGSAQPTQSNNVTGTLTYLPKILLPTDSLVTIRIEDISLADAPAEVISETTFVTNGLQVPIPFELGYDPTKIEESRRYNLQIRIENGAGKLLFISDTINSIITQGNPVSDIEVILKMVSGGSN